MNLIGDQVNIHKSICLFKTQDKNCCLEKQFQHETLAHDDEMSMSSSELQAFEYMKENTRYDPKLKRFTVRLLWKPYLKDNKLVPGPPPLRSTFNIATSRFLHMEKQLKNIKKSIIFA